MFGRNLTRYTNDASVTVSIIKDTRLHKEYSINWPFDIRLHITSVFIGSML